MPSLVMMMQTASSAPHTLSTVFLYCGTIARPDPAKLLPIFANKSTAALVLFTALIDLTHEMMAVMGLVNKIRPKTLGHAPT
jgi:hypothetical protein